MRSTVAIEGEEWRDLLDRFVTKTDLEQFQSNVEKILVGMSAKLDQVVFKETHAIILRREEDWKSDATEKMKAMQADINVFKRNQAPAWMPNTTHILGWIITIYIAYNTPHFWK